MFSKELKPPTIDKLHITHAVLVPVQKRRTPRLIFLVGSFSVTRTGSNKQEVHFSGHVFARGMPVSTSFFRGKTAFVFQAHTSSVGSLRENGRFFLSRGQIKETAVQRFFLEKKTPFPVRKVDSSCPKLWFLKKIKTTWRQHGTLESDPPILKVNKNISFSQK